MDLNRHIWEGWTVQSFIDELEPMYNQVFSDRGNYPWQRPLLKSELKEWCISEQPYYKKYIPEVVNYFWNKYSSKWESANKKN